MSDATPDLPAHPSAASGDAETPQQRLGPEALKALTHPLRMQMWEYLVDHGSATATQLARALGESSGQTSYHLRQLERFGFIEDDPGRPAGRERWWRSVGFQVTPEDLLDDDMREETMTLLRTHLAARAAFVLGWIERHRDEPRDWLEASTSIEATVPLTAAELEALTAELDEVIRKHSRAAKALVASGDAAVRRRVRVYLDALPVPTQE